MIFLLFIGLVSALNACDPCYDSMGCMFCQHSYTLECAKCWSSNLLPGCTACYMEEYAPSTTRDAQYEVIRLQAMVSPLVRMALLSSDRLHPCLKTPDSAHVTIDGSTIATLDIYRRHETKEITISVILDDICLDVRNAYKGPYSWNVATFTNVKNPRSIFYPLRDTLQLMDIEMNEEYLSIGETLKITWNKEKESELDGPMRSLTIDPILVNEKQCVFYDFTFGYPSHVSFVSDVLITFPLLHWFAEMANGLHANGMVISDISPPDGSYKGLKLPTIVDYQTEPHCFPRRLAASCFQGSNLSEWEETGTWSSEQCQNDFVRQCMSCFVKAKAKAATILTSSPI